MLLCTKLQNHGDQNPLHILCIYINVSYSKILITTWIVLVKSSIANSINSPKCQNSKRQCQLNISSLITIGVNDNIWPCHIKIEKYRKFDINGQKYDSVFKADAIKSDKLKRIPYKNSTNQKVYLAGLGVGSDMEPITNPRDMSLAKMQAILSHQEELQVVGKYYQCVSFYSSAEVYHKKAKRCSASR